MRIKTMLNDNILVKKTEDQNKTQGGLIIPTNVKNYTVVEIVKTPEDFPIASAGDKVYISLYAGIDISFDGEDFMIITSKDIILRV